MISRAALRASLGAALLFVAGCPLWVDWDDPASVDRHVHEEHDPYLGTWSVYTSPGVGVHGAGAAYLDGSVWKDGRGSTSLEVRIKHGEVPKPSEGPFVPPKGVNRHVRDREGNSFQAKHRDFDVSCLESTCRLYESVWIYLPSDYLEAHRETGLDLKIYGKPTRTVRVEAMLLDRYLARLAERSAQVKAANAQPEETP